MSHVEIVKEVFAGMDQGDFGKFDRMTTDDCVITGPAPEPLPKHAFIAMQGAVVRAIPDWKFNISEIHEEGDTVHVTANATGKHTAELVLPDMPPIPATGKTIRQPQEHIDLTFRGDKISNVFLRQVPGGGILGLLQQLGVELPAHA
jgi:predicted ester cyclase